MLRKKKTHIKTTCNCNKCGKPAPTEMKGDWIVYKTGKPCECGGQFVMKHEIVED